MGKKPTVSVTYENERISVKNSLPYVAGDDPNKQTNEKRNFEGCVAAG